jgi:hypothetical protein
MPATLEWQINGGHHLNAWVSGTELFEISPSGGSYRLAFECIVCFKSLFCGDFPYLDAAQQAAAKRLPEYAEMSQRFGHKGF